MVMGLAPMGCAPHYLWKHRSQNGECIKDINNMIIEFNFAMRHMIQELNYELSDAKFIFCDVYEGAMDIIENHRRYGNHKNFSSDSSVQSYIYMLNSESNYSYQNLNLMLYTVSCPV